MTLSFVLFRFITSSLTLGFLISASFGCNDTRTRLNPERPATILVNAEIAALKEGDIFLQAGWGLVADTILSSLDEHVGLTHSAVLYKKNGEWFVIQAINELLTGKKGVHFQELPQFLQATRPDSLILVRPHLSESQRQEFLEYLTFHAERGTPFDNSFSWEDSSAFYCSELVIKALIAANVQGLENELVFRGPILAFSTFLNPNYFEVIFSQHRDFSYPLQPTPDGE